MKPALLLYIDWNRDRWTVQYRSNDGEVIEEMTDYPANVPSIVVSDAIQQVRPGSRILAKLF